MTDLLRPDPDALLASVQREAARAARGRLKIFMGASPGVGKTFAMLEAAQARRREGADVVAGVVETHGRGDTAALLDGLEVLPRRREGYRGTVLEEFDLDAALARRPRLLLVDELAHTNAPGSRHARRVQDVEELLAAGIDVYTTLNVQHLESLNDVVARITGVVVRETVPDAILDAADEVELVDVSPEVLEARLREGKVYLPEQAQRALDRFFRRGNLIALRELALRRTAARVDAEMREHRASAGVRETWPTTERLVVAVAPSPRAASLVRAGRRLADQLRAPWTAVYVELPGHAAFPAARRELAQEALRLAEELGGAAAVLTGHDAAEELLAWAREHNATRVLVAPPGGGRLARLRPWATANRLLRRAAGIDVVVVAAAGAAPAPVLPAARGERPPAAKRWRAYAAVAAIIAAATLLALPFQGVLAEIDAAMLYLLAVVVAALRYGRGPSVAASALAVAAFDICFVPPYWTFTVADLRFVLTFLVMFAVGLALGGLATRVREQADAARQRERRTATLYHLSRDLAAARTRPAIARAMLRHVHDLFGGTVRLLLPDDRGVLERVAELAPDTQVPADLGVARWVFDRGEPAGLGTDTLPAAAALYLPLRTDGRTLGVVGLRPARPAALDEVANRQLLDAMLDQAAIALERTELAEQKRAAHLAIEAERLRTSLLSSLSHDLRTPLAGIEGAASGLLEGDAALHAPARRELAATILGEAQRMTRLVGNLLNMVRVESGALAVQREWHVLEEIVGVALLRLDERLAGRAVTVALPADLPLVPVDDVLLEQVFVNLLENAARYTPAGAPIDIGAAARPGAVEAWVADRGPGVPKGEEELVFEKFHRAAAGVGGIGLGLAICRGIVTAHGGRIWCAPRPGGGAEFRFTLPVTEPPPAPPREPEAAA